jgi:hypothetical protein
MEEKKSTDKVKPEQKLKVFLCHAPQDEIKAKALYKRLSADKYDVWRAEKNLLPGQNWQDEIQEAMRASDVIIICLSEKSINKEGYVQKEIREAINIAYEKPERTIFIIPTRFDKECAIPSKLSDWQAANLFQKDGYNGLKAALRKRANDLNKIESESKRQSPKWFIVALALIIILSILIGVSLRQKYLISSTTPYTLVITIFNETSKGVVKEFPPIELTNASAPPDALSVKGDSPVTVEVHAKNWFGKEISPDTLDYRWELCCNDKQNKTPIEGHLPTWKFEPPTYLPTETLTVTVSNKKGSSVEVAIPFTITIR